MQSGKVLLIGFGSIGTFHLKKLNSIYKYITVVEPNIHKHISATNNLSNIFFTTSIDDVADLDSYKFAVIANWGPDHLKTVNYLHNAGVKKFIIEKPLCDSLFEVERFEKLIKSKEISIISHLQWSYSFLPKIIQSYASQNLLGAPVSIVVNGGAKCLATNGIHFLALANVIFGGEPLEDSMLAKHDFMNPRNMDFLYLEGNVSWKYSNSRYLSINFFNRSHNSITTLINFEYGVGIIANDQLKLYSIAKSSREQIDKPSKTKFPSELLYEGEAFNFPDGTDGTDQIYKKIEGELDSFDQLHLIQVTRTFLNTLNKNFERKLFSNLFKKRRKWKIS